MNCETGYKSWSSNRYGAFYVSLCMCPNHGPLCGGAIGTLPRPEVMAVPTHTTAGTEDFLPSDTTRPTRLFEPPQRWGARRHRVSVVSLHTYVYGDGSILCGHWVRNLPVN